MTFATACSINRYYDPATGQFVSVDPLVNETDQAYVYAGDDPINYTDSTGLWFGIDDLIATVVGAVVGGTTSVVEQVVEGHGINWTKVSISASAGGALGWLGPGDNIVTRVGQSVFFGVISDWWISGGNLSVAQASPIPHNICLASSQSFQ
jgi:uncharacterized protein RhaS with RHS repeats